MKLGTEPIYAPQGALATKFLPNKCVLLITVHMVVKREALEVLLTHCKTSYKCDLALAKTLGIIYTNTKFG